MSGGSQPATDGDGSARVIRLRRKPVRIRRHRAVRCNHMPA